MDINEYTKQKGQFLKAEDVKANPTSVFIPASEGEMVENQFGNLRLHIEGEFNGEQVVFDCAKTNAQILKELLGENTKSWVGKSIQLETYKTRTSEGKMVDAISIKKPTSNAP